jgi:hypothetical protein
MHYHRHFTPVVPGADFVFTMLQEMFFLSQNLREALQKQGNGTVAVVVLRLLLCNMCEKQNTMQQNRFPLGCETR